MKRKIFFSVIATFVTSTTCFILVYIFDNSLALSSIDHELKIEHGIRCDSRKSEFLLRSTCEARPSSFATSDQHKRKTAQSQVPSITNNKKSYPPLTTRPSSPRIKRSKLSSPCLFSPVEGILRLLCLYHHICKLCPKTPSRSLARN